MPRQARLDFPGTLHHVICRGIEKKAIVSDDRDRDYFIERFGNLAAKTDTAVYAWALMRNHVHILLRSGPAGISEFMRKLLTGYAIAYNRRHDRHGYLFQNRYKSIICEEGTYLLELVRYIHLNPVRAGAVKTLEELDPYPYSGHSVILGKVRHGWQDRDYILRLFGDKEGRAKREYRKFMEAGIGQGNRPELVGGGLIRSQGGWSQVVSMRRRKEAEQSDERILGSGDFVERIMAEAEQRQSRMFSGASALEKVDETIRAVCEEEGVRESELRNGSRRRQVSRVRKKIARELIERYGIPMATVARETGVTTSAISKLMIQ
ncbi:MAG: transposase [Nitrospirota bacterium]